MALDPFPTVLEYLREGEQPQVKKNAITALAILGGPQSVRLLVDTAIGPRTSELRERAEEELIALAGPDEDSLADVLSEYLRDPARRVNAYALAGRLRSKGWGGRLSLPWHRRLLLANSLRKVVYPDRTWRLRLRAVAPGFLGGVVGMVLVIAGFKILGVGLDGDTLAGMVMLSVLVSPLLTMAVTRAAVPAALFYDPAAAVAVEAGAAGLAGLVAGVPLILLAVLLSMESNAAGALIAFMLGIAPTAAAVRAGTLLAAGALPEGRAARLRQIAVGTAAGWLVVSAVYLVVAGGEATVEARSWSLLLSAGVVALATAYASIDRQGAMRTAFLEPLARPLSLARDPLPTVLEYLRDGEEPQVKKNAITALAILGGPQSVRLLVDTAVDPRTSELRERAEEELIALTGPDEDCLADVLSEYLRDPARRVNAYALAGRLRSRGWAGRLSLPWHRRLLLANSLRKVVYPDRTWRLRLRAVAPGFLGGVVGMVLVIAGLKFLGIVVGGDILAGMVMLSVLVSPLLPMAVTRAAVPAALFYDPAAAVAVEAGAAGLAGLVTGVPLILLAVLLSMESNAAGALIAFMLGIAPTAAAVRAGTLLAAGALPEGRVARLLQIAVGTAAGWLVVSAVYLVVAGGEATVEAGNWWLLLSAVVVALATVYASVDRQVAMRSAFLGPLARPVSLGSIAVLLVSAALLTIPGSATTWPAGAERTRVSVPATITLPSGALRSTDVTVLSGGAFRDDRYALQLWHRVGVLWIPASEAALRGTLTTAIRAGPDTRLVVERHDRGAANQLFERLRYRVGLSSAGPRDEVELGFGSGFRSARSRDSTRTAVFDSLLESADSLVQDGKIDESKSVFAELLRQDSAAIESWRWNDLCWYGSLYGHHADTMVVQACTLAVAGAVDEELTHVRDSRGLNLALNGDKASAVRDFRYFVQYSSDTAAVDERKDWITVLSANGNPFTPEVLQQLKVENSIPPLVPTP